MQPASVPSAYDANCEAGEDQSFNRGDTLGQPSPATCLPAYDAGGRAGQAGRGWIKASTTGRHPEAAADFHPTPPMHILSHVVTHAYCPIVTRIIIDARVHPPSSQPSIDRFLKLMLGVAVTCSNKQTFIDKIQVTPTLAMADDEDGWHC